MLSQVRNTLKGAAAWFIVVLLILAFALWGVPELRQFSGSAAVTVGDQSFSPQYVQNEFTRQMQIRRNQSGGSLTQEDAIAAGLHNEIVASITTTSMLDQYADKMNLSIPRDFVRDYVQGNENFQNPATGDVDETVLKSILQANNMTFAEFEKRISDSLRRDQLIGALASNGSAPKAFVDAMILRDTEQRQIAYLIVTEEMAGKAAEPTPADLEEFYQQNPSQFTAPEYRTFDILVIRDQDFRKEQEAPEEELRRIYDVTKARAYEQPERRTLYQITFDTEAEAKAVAAALEQGKPFENVATEAGRTLQSLTFTDAAQSDLLDPAVGAAAFKAELEEGAVVGPVQSAFGFTVVQIAGITPAQTQTFEEVRDQIEADYLDQDTRRALLNAIDEIEEVRDTGASLADAAHAAGLEVVTVGPVDRYSFAPGGAIVDRVPGEALGEIFSLEEDEETEAVELAARDGYFYAALHEITPPALKPFEDVRDDVEQKWRNHEREQRVADTVRAIRDSVASGQTLEEASNQFNRTPTVLVVDRRFENEAISGPFNDQLFSAAKGELVSGPAALGQAQIVAEIRKVGFEPGRVAAAQQQQFAQYVGFQLDQETIEAFIAAMQADYDIEVNQSQLDVIFGQNQ